jgi:NAD(P)H dehydrogenase (quinone)
MVGSRTVRRLIADDHAVLAVSRDPERTRNMLPPAVDIRRADLTDGGSLEAVLADASAVVVIHPLSVEPEGAFNAEREGTRAILDALPKNRLIRVVKLSEIGAGSDPGFRDLQAKADAERLIQASGQPYVILRPTWFMEAWLRQLRAGPDFLAIGSGARAVHWLSLDDMTRWISSAVTSPSVANRVLTAQGAEALTIPEAAARLAAVTGGQVIRMPVEGVRSLDAPTDMVRTLVELFTYYERAPEPFEADELWRSLGAPTVSFDAFARSLE